MTCKVEFGNQEWYSIFSVAYKLIVGFAAVGIINGVFMHLGREKWERAGNLLPWQVSSLNLNPKPLGPTPQTLNPKP